MPFSEQSQEEAQVNPTQEKSQSELVEEFFADGRIRRRGYRRAGLRVGEWREWHPNGHVASIERFEDGEREGLCESFYRDGSPKARRTFSAGLEEGTRLIWYLDGTTWEENFRAGVKHGVWIERKEGQIVAIRHFQDGEEV